MANTASTWQYVVVTGSTWCLLPRKISPIYCHVSYVAVTRIPSLVLRNTWHYVIIRYSYGELPKFFLRCSYEAALRKGVTTALRGSSLTGLLYAKVWPRHKRVGWGCVIQSVPNLIQNFRNFTIKICVDYCAAVCYPCIIIQQSCGRKGICSNWRLLKPMDSFGMWWKSKWNYFSSLNHNFIVLCELFMPCQLFAQKCSNCQEITKILKCSGSPGTFCHW